MHTAPRACFAASGGSGCRPTRAPPGRPAGCCRTCSTRSPAWTPRWPTPRSSWPASSPRTPCCTRAPSSRSTSTSTTAGSLVTVTDRGSGPLEAHLAEPRRRYGRAAAHGRGLGLVASLADGLGHPPRRRRAAHDRGSRSRPRPRPRRAAPAAPPDTAAAPGQPRAGPAAAARAGGPRATGSQPLGAGRGARPAPARRARRATPWPSSSTRATAPGRARSPAPGRAGGAVVPRRRAARHTAAARRDPAARPADATATAARTWWSWSPTASPWPSRPRWLRAVDQRRRAWMAYLAEASELLGQSLSVELAVAVVPQVVVPRLGALVRRVPATTRAGCGSPRSPTPTRTSCPSCARRSTPAAPGPARAARPAGQAARRMRRRSGSPRRPTGSPCRSPRTPARGER